LTKFLGVNPKSSETRNSPPAKVVRRMGGAEEHRIDLECVFERREKKVYHGSKAINSSIRETKGRGGLGGRTPIKVNGGCHSPHLKSPNLRERDGATRRPRSGNHGGRERSVPGDQGESSSQC